MKQAPALPTFDFTEELAKLADAERSGDWPRATHIWTNLKIRNFDSRMAAIGIARCLRAQGLLDEADRFLTEEIEISPEDTGLLAEYALVAKVRGDHPECARRWRSVFRLDPDNLLFVGEIAMAFFDDGEAGLAVDLLQKAEARSPRNVGVLIPKAVIGERMQNWAESARCWREVRTLLPDNIGIARASEKALWNAALEEDGQARADTQTGFLRGQGRMTLDTAILADFFESLGDNCELGIVQRRLGAEPAGLYRFAAVHPNVMLELLSDRFAALGDEGHTVIDDTEDEYIAYDDRGYFYLHTTVNKNDMDSAKILKQQLARISILRRKILSTLAGNRKIFVIKDFTKTSQMIFYPGYPRRFVVTRTVFCWASDFRMRTTKVDRSNMSQKT